MEARLSAPTPANHRVQALLARARDELLQQCLPNATAAPIGSYVHAVLHGEPIAWPSPELTERGKAGHTGVVGGHDQREARVSTLAPARTKCLCRDGIIGEHRRRCGDDIVVDGKNPVEVFVHGISNLRDRTPAGASARGRA